MIRMFADYIKLRSVGGYNQWSEMMGLISLICNKYYFLEFIIKIRRIRAYVSEKGPFIFITKHKQGTEIKN